MHSLLYKMFNNHSYLLSLAPLIIDDILVYFEAWVKQWLPKKKAAQPVVAVQIRAMSKDCGILPLSQPYKEVSEQVLVVLNL